MRLAGQKKSRLWIYRSLIAACLFNSPFQAAHSAGDAPGIASDPSDTSAPPAIGNINGIKLSIPHYYLLSGVQYAGEQPLSFFRSFTPTYDSKIEDFAILLRLSNLQPIRTEQDREDYKRSEHTVIPFIYETWTTIGYAPNTAPNHNWPDKNAFNVVNRWEANKFWGPFVRQKERIAGLVEEDTVQTILNDEAHPNFDFYYDDKTFNTFIHCQTIKTKVPPYDTFTNCEHSFLIPDLKIEAEAFYTKKDLPRWREIEAKASQIIHSFIVK